MVKPCNYEEKNRSNIFALAVTELMERERFNCFRFFLLNPSIRRRSHNAVAQDGITAFPFSSDDSQITCIRSIRGEFFLKVRLPALSVA